MMDDDVYDDYYEHNQTCHSVGINGGCGPSCPVFQQGDCESYGDLLEDMVNDPWYDVETIQELLDYYGADEHLYKILKIRKL